MKDLLESRSDTRRPLLAVTGSTGFIGRFLTRELAERGWPVRALARDAVQAGYCLGDLEGDPDWPHLLDGVDTVIHAAAIAHCPLSAMTRTERARLRRVNVEVVGELARQCRRAGVRQLIFLSSAKVYGESSPPGRALLETDPLSPEDEYGLGKREAEKLLLEIAGDGLGCSLLRLPLVYGPGVKANFQRLWRLSGSAWPLPLGSIRNRRSVLALDNLLQVVGILLDERDPGARIFNVADPEPVSTPALIAMLAGAQGKPARLVPCPVSVLKAAGWATGRRGEVARLTGNFELSLARLRERFPGLTMISTGEAVRRLR